MRLLERLVNFVTASEGGRTFKLTPQDVALCQLWASTGSSAPEGLAARVDAWIRNPDIPDENTAGRRHQMLLRDLIDLTRKDHLEALSGDEAAFLCAVFDLLHKVRDRSAFARVEELLRDHVRLLAARREARGLTPGLASLARRIKYVTEDDILQAPQQHIRLLAGIELPCRGPVYTNSGHLRILGDVPDNCTVVAEHQGCCSVDGYVMGRILAKHQCEIRHNISGVAIVLDGNIRARGIINNAIAIAKMGNVVCQNAQGPKLVFAGKSIQVADITMMGKFVTRDMAVGREVRGSHIEIAGTGSAGYVRHLGTSSTTVVLRRELSCEDFGEVTGAELNRLLSQAYKLRRRARNFTHLAEAARHEANHTAQSVLMVIFGGGEVQKRLEGFLRAQRRHRFVSQVVENLRSMLDYARDGFAGAEDDEFSGAAAEADEALDKDDEDLQAVREEAETLERTLRSRALDRHQSGIILEEIRQKLAAMRVLQQQAEMKMLEEERGIQHLEKYDQILAGSGREATKLDVLNKILPALQNQPPESTMGKRLRASYVVRALRSVDRAVRHAAEFDRKAEENLTDFRAVSERLGKDFQVRVLENPEDEASAARVTGRFEAGVRIFMDEYTESLSDLPSDRVLTTPEDSGVRTYLRQGDGAGFYSADT